MPYIDDVDAETFISHEFEREVEFMRNEWMGEDDLIAYAVSPTSEEVFEYVFSQMLMRHRFLDQILPPLPLSSGARGGHTAGSWTEGGDELHHNVELAGQRIVAYASSARTVAAVRCLLEVFLPRFVGPPTAEHYTTAFEGLCRGALVPAFFFEDLIGPSSLLCGDNLNRVLRLFGLYLPGVNLARLQKDALRSDGFKEHFLQAMRRTEATGNPLDWVDHCAGELERILWADEPDPARCVGDFMRDVLAFDGVFIGEW